MAPHAQVIRSAMHSSDTRTKGHVHVQRSTEGNGDVGIARRPQPNWHPPDKEPEASSRSQVKDRVPFIPERCRLATTTGTHEESELMQILRPVIDGDRSSNIGWSSSISGELLQAAWANLLRIYTRSDIVSFALLLDPDGTDPNRDSTRHEMLDKIGEALMCQYHYPDRLLRGCGPDVCCPLTLEDMERTELNTAVRLSFCDGSISVPKRKAFPLSTQFNVQELAYRFDLFLDSTQPGSLRDISIRYRCSRISEKYAEAIALTFRGIVTHMISNNASLPVELNDPSEEDKRTLLSWNAKELYTNNGCVHQAIGTVAVSMPESQAICAWDGSLTYSKLDALSLSFARHLLRVGIRPGSIVPFALEKGLWAVVTLLGILKAGCAFVPLDPADPKARLRETLNSTEASAIVTSSTFEKQFSSFGKQIVLVPPPTGALQENKNGFHARLPTVQSSDPVFVLFTSGSTGRPKGIVHEHRAICTHAMAHGEAMGYHSARVLQFAAFTFDVAFIDIFTTLMFGGCVCIPSEEDRMTNITHVMRSMQVNYALLTPSFASLIQPQEVPCLKTFALAGECLTQDIIQRWGGKVRIINAYGPAEVGIFMVMDVDPARTRAETIGYPLRNSSCWLVDPKDHDHLVPIGAVGELLVASSSLARGYLKDEAKTNSSFIPKPSWAVALGVTSSRFYKTGDLCRHNIELFDGSYDFVCRKDTQVKFHGQRIELGEVEHHLAGIPGIVVSMVALPERGCFKGKLVAVMQMCGASPSPRISKEPIELAVGHPLPPLDKVKNGLARHLSRHMVPAEFIFVTNLPFLSSCKVDRKLVGMWLEGLTSRPLESYASETSRITIGTRSNATSPLTESTAATIRAKIANLKGQTNGYQALEHQDYLLQAAGLDSIQVVSLSMFLRKTFGVKLPMQKLLDSRTTIWDLANGIDGQNHCSSQSLHLLNDTGLVHRDGVVEGIDLLEEKRLCCSRLFADLDSLEDPKTPPQKPMAAIRNVFLTGATGYLGLRIVRHILVSRPELHIFTLVRCSTISEGLAHIIYGAGQTGGWWQECYASRIHVWPGDLLKQNLGLEDEHLQQLQGTSLQQESHIHIILHNGARVHYKLNYETLKAVNVLPTLELLNMTATAANISTFVYVSGGRRPCSSPEDDEAAEAVEAAEVAQANGYVQTKLLSEWMVRACSFHARFKGRRMRIIRPGYIIGPPNNAVPNQTDFFWRLVAGCLEIGAYNADEAHHWLFISDAEHVAQVATDGALSELQQSESQGEGVVASHIVEGLPFEDLWTLLKSDHGYKLEPLPQDQWLRRLEQAIMAKQEAHPLFPFAENLFEEAIGLGSPNIRGCMAGGDRARAAVRQNIQSCVRSAFFPAPPYFSVP